MDIDNADWLNIIGSVLLLLGLGAAFLSSHYEQKVMGSARLGVAVLGPSPGSLKYEQKQGNRLWADWTLYVGLIVTAIGVMLQTIGSIMR